MSLSTKSLTQTGSVVPPPEVMSFTDEPTFFVGGSRGSMSISAGGGAVFGSQGGSTMTFTIPPVSTQWIDLSTFNLSFLHSAQGNIGLVAGAANLISHLTVTTGTGLVLSEVGQYGMLDACINDFTSSDGEFDSRFNEGYGPGLDRVVNHPTDPTLSKALTRRYQVPLNHTLLGSERKYILPSDFGGLVVRVTVTDAAKAHVSLSATPVNNPTYTVSDARLDFDTIELERGNQMQMDGLLAKTHYYRFKSFTHTSTAFPAQEQADIQVPSRGRSKNYVLIGLQKASNANRSVATIEDPTDRTHADIDTWQFEIGGKRTPQVPASRIEAYSHVKNIFGSKPGNVGIFDFVGNARETTNRGRMFLLGKDLRLTHDDTLQSGDTELAATAQSIVCHITRRGGRGMGASLGSPDDFAAPSAPGTGAPSDLQPIVAHSWVNYDTLVKVSGGTVEVIS